MPFGYAYYQQSERGYKRRRLSSDVDMARKIHEPLEAADTPDEENLLLATEKECQQTESKANAEVETSDRDELMQRIKRGERPTWIPKPGLEALIMKHEEDACTQDDQLFSNGADDPYAAVTDSISENPFAPPNDRVTDPIERPRSAFHTGDFHAQSHEGYSEGRQTPNRNRGSEGFSTSPPPWLSSAPHPSLSRARTEISMGKPPIETVRRSRAPSLGSSLSSSFVLRVPTSPLVHAVNNMSTEFSQQLDMLPLSSTAEQSSNQRRTLPPEAFQSLDSHFIERRSMNFSRPLPTPVRRETSLPHQLHQPRRSLNSFTYQPASSPRTPISPRSRRPSFPSDSSPIQHAAMVGSFEESILRGRMSTAPSKPLDFVAQIGVLGKGNCKPSLKCPAHVTVPFPAVFYSYPSTTASRSPMDDSPSPYVGRIDLEHNLRPAEIRKNQKRRHEQSQDPDERMADITSPENTAIGRALARDERRTERRATSPKVPVGGCYRVPQQGQLQIIIKNPNKTAVKLYLVPYHLEDMEPGTKTFVRQRSFSAGPILEKPLSGSPEAMVVVDPLQEKHILRYLIHLKFCCPSKGRFYLYDNVRVVFANRVPDGKERLRNEVQLPEPRYSPYKPGRDSSMGSAGARLAAEKALHRRSSGFSMPAQLYDAVDGFQLDRSNVSDELPPLPTSNIPFHIAPKPRPLFGRSDSEEAMANRRLDQPFDFSNKAFAEAQSQTNSQDRAADSLASFDASPLTRKSPLSWSPDNRAPSSRTYSPVPPEPGEGLLSRKFREHKEGVAMEGKGI